MEMLKTIHLVGMGLGLDYITPAIARLIASADVLAGSPRWLDLYPDHSGRRLPLAGTLSDWLEKVTVAAVNERVVILASGDPNFFGIADRLVKRVGQENVRIYPNVTVIQAAFARLKESWAGIKVISLHGRSEDILFQAISNTDRLAVYTDPVNTPARIAELLIGRGQNGWRMCVLEDLGSPDSRISFSRLSDMIGKEFSPLNLVVLWKKEATSPLTLGTPEEDFIHEAGLITKTEVRAVALAKLSLGPNQTLWDLGAGCGSVGLAASLLMPGGRIIAVERVPERIAMIKANQARFGVAGLSVVQGEMPQVLTTLPAPDRVFIGGGGPILSEIVYYSAQRLSAGGVIVVNAVKLDSLESARDAMWDLALDTTQVQISRETQIGDGYYLKAHNPVWLVTGRKGI